MTTTNRELSPLVDAAKVKVIKEAMNERELFPSLAAAIAKLESVAAVTLKDLPEGSEPFFGLPVAIKGQKDDGTFDESIYEGRDAGLVFVGAKLDKATGIKSIAIIPFPRVAEFMASELGQAFVARTVEKECALVAFRQFREASSLVEFESGVGAVPVTADDFGTASTRGLDTTTFDKVWKPFREALKEKSEAMYKLLPLKNEFRDAMRSKAFAAEHDKTRAFEEQGLIVGLSNVLIATAKNWTENGKASPLDTTIIESWLAGREEFVIEEKDSVERDYSVLANIKLNF